MLRLAIRHLMPSSKIEFRQLDAGGISTDMLQGCPLSGLVLSGAMPLDEAEELLVLLSTHAGHGCQFLKVE